MKFLILLFVVVVVYNGMVSAGCTDELKNKLIQCYNSSAFALNALTFRDNFPSMFINYTNLHDVCADKKSLETCLTPEIKKNCFNYVDLANISFSKEENNDQNRIYALVNYLQHEYVCGDAVKVLRDHHICIGFQGASAECPLNFDTIANVKEYATCATNIITKRCGPAAGCFAQKFLSVHHCYTETESDDCKAITYENNPMKGCDADITGGSESSYVLGFVLIITIFLSF